MESLVVNPWFTSPKVAVVVERLNVQAALSNGESCEYSTEYVKFLLLEQTQASVTLNGVSAVSSGIHADLVADPTVTIIGADITNLL
jgi:hypothetical protein